MPNFKRVAAAVVVGVMLMAGCGSSDGDDTVASDTDTTASDLGTTDPAAGTTGSDPDAGGGAEPIDDAGDASDEGTSAGDVDTCAIVEMLDIEGLLGEPGNVVDDTSDLAASCTVEPVDTASNAALRLTVETQRGPENFAQQKELLGVDTEVDGFGDEAFHTGPYLFVLRGDTLAFIQVFRSAENGMAVDDSELEAAMTTVMGELD